MDSKKIYSISLLISSVLVNGSNAIGQTSSAQTLEALPDGIYLYEGERLDDPSITSSGNLEVVLQKQNGNAIGIGIAFRDGNGCFMGSVDGDMVSDVVLAFEPSDRGRAWSFKPGRNISLSNFRLQSNEISGRTMQLLNDCIEVYKNR